MRYAADHKQKTRQRILDAAAIVFRRKGFAGGSVDDVMAEAGLTAGGFYAHFHSKDELFAEALLQTLRQGRVVYGKDDTNVAGAERVQAIARKYLSPAHRRMVDRGCPMPPLVADLARQSPATRRAFEKIVAEIMASLEPHLSTGEGTQEPDQALAILALMVGGLSLARAVADEGLADRILAACRQLIDSAISTPKKRKRRT